MHRRLAAAAIAALLLAGCGSATGGRAPTAAKPAAPKTVQTPAPAKRAQSGKGAPPLSAAAPKPKLLRAPREVTLADNGAVVELSTGGSFTLKLPAPAGWRWRVLRFAPSVLAESAGAAGTQGVFRAVGAGTTLLTAEEVPPCGNACRNKARGPLFSVGVRVAP